MWAIASLKWGVLLWCGAFVMGVEMERTVSTVEWCPKLERKKEVGVGDTEVGVEIGVGVEITHKFHVHSKSFHTHSKSNC